MTEPLSFFPVEKKHHEIILDWLAKEHVKEYFYAEGLENTIKSLDLSIKGVRFCDDYTYEHWIAYSGNKPFGFLMTSLVEGPYQPKDPVNKWFDEDQQTITLDVLIGDEEFLGKGLSTRMIQEFLLDKFSQAFAVLIDSAASNTKAIHVYEKVGFKKIEQFLPKYDPTPHWMMRLEMKDLLNLI